MGIPKMTSSGSLTSSARYTCGEAPDLLRILRFLNEAILDGLRHGYFDFQITGEMIEKKLRLLRIRAGKSFQYRIEEDEIYQVMRDLRDGGAILSDGSKASDRCDSGAQADGAEDARPGHLHPANPRAMGNAD
jgi:hypothetical protein